MLIGMSSRVEIVVQDVPAELRAALVADAAARNVSINEAAVAPLAEHFGVEREPSGRPHRGESGSTQLLLAVPDDLRQAIRLMAARKGATIRGIVIQVLSDHYGLDGGDQIGRRPRNTASV